jgi:hypothetical protein
MPNFSMATARVAEAITAVTCTESPLSPGDAVIVAEDKLNQRAACGGETQKGAITAGEKVAAAHDAEDFWHFVPVG